MTSESQRFVDPSIGGTRVPVLVPARMSSLWRANACKKGSSFSEVHQLFTYVSIRIACCITRPLAVLLMMLLVLMRRMLRDDTIYLYIACWPVGWHSVPTDRPGLCGTGGRCGAVRCGRSVKSLSFLPNRSPRTTGTTTTTTTTMTTTLTIGLNQLLRLPPPPPLGLPVLRLPTPPVTAAAHQRSASAATPPSLSRRTQPSCARFASMGACSRTRTSMPSAAAVLAPQGWPPVAFPTPRVCWRGLHPDRPPARGT